MSDTTLEHPLVRAYLDELAAALASLPPERAAELRDQIAAHLDEELPPLATDVQVADAIKRMGRPADLAREAGARRTLRAAIKRRSWRFWTVMGVVLTSAGVFISLFVRVESAPALRYDGSYGWWYAQDGKHEVESQAQGYDQLTIPVRWHQRQGYYVELFNFSGYTQTILGDAGAVLWPDPATTHLAVSIMSSPSGNPPSTPEKDRYGLPVSIPPGQSRYLRVIWTSENFCVQRNGTFGTDAVTLRVRVGWITRLETITLPTEFTLTGTSDRCPDQG